MSIPAQIGKYEVLEAIGRGGFATVYKARDPLMRRLIAIKLCTEQDEDLRRRFLREAQIAGSLDHPSIVRGFDCGYDAAGVYLVEEYLDGEDLKQKIQARSPIPYLRRLNILLEVAQAIGYAHSKGVYHRDIKPGNIRVLDSGHVKIMDFGIAKSSSSKTPLTKAGTLLGTAGYVAPEQVLGQPVDHRVDVFAFGALAYEFFTYHRPFTGQTVSERLRSVIDTVPEPISKYWLDCPPGLERVIEHCLEKDPESRYHRFAEVITDLEKVREDMTRAEEEVTSTLAQRTPTATEPTAHADPGVAGDVTAPPPASSPPPVAGPAFDATVLVPPDDAASDPVTVPPSAAAARPPSSATSNGAAGAGLDQTLVAAVDDPPPAPVVAAPAPPATSLPLAAAVSAPSAARVPPPPPATVPAPPAAAAVAPPTAGARAGSTSAGASRRWLIVGAGVVLFGAAAITLVLLFAKERGESRVAAAPSPPPPSSDSVPPPEPAAAVNGQLIVSASPWGELVEIIGSDGKPIAMPTGAGATPLILTLPIGEYEVRVARPSGDEEPGTCRATVVAATAASCRIELTRITAREYFKAAGWWQ